MSKFLRNIGRVMALVLTIAMIMCSLSGCELLLEDEPSNSSQTSDAGNGNQGQSSNNGNKDATQDIIGMLFDAFFGGDSSDYGWGESSYEGESGNIPSNFQYADVSSIPAGGGTATIMMYIIGSNLETENGCATMDIQEMIASELGDNVNMIIEAGGAKKWQNSVMTSGKTGRYRVLSEGIQNLDTPTQKSMVEPSEISSFINFCVKNYPADRYGLIFWDHGGGTIAGFGTDELYSESLSLDEISSAVKNTNVHFDFIGFDACLMGTIETAYSLRNSADYLIASEETMPGLGWSYIGWLKALSKNPSLDMEKLGSIIIDDFTASNGASDITLSLIDLSKIESVYAKLAELCAKGSEALYAGQYNTLSSARKKCKAFGNGGYEQIDIIDFCNRCELNGASDMIAAVNDCIKYHKTNIKGTNGLAMYFPFDYPSYYNQIRQMLKGFGMDNSSCTGFFNDLLSGRSGGHTSKAKSAIEVKTGYDSGTEETDYTQEDWYNNEISSAAGIVEFPLTEDGLLPLTESEDNYVVELTPEQWDAVVLADIGVYVDLDEGLIDIGSDSLYSFDENGNMIVDYDNTWVTINGQYVNYISEGAVEYEDGTWAKCGYVPALYTSARTGEAKLIELMLYWDQDYPAGIVRGYRTATDTSEGPSQAERSINSFVKGDKILFYFDFYTYDGDLIDQYPIADEIVYDGNLTVAYEDIGESDQLIYAHLQDIYGNDYYSEFLVIYGSSEE